MLTGTKKELAEVKEKTRLDVEIKDAPANKTFEEQTLRATFYVK